MAATLVCLGLACVFALSGSSGVPRSHERIVIAYLGRLTPAEDSNHQQFLAALQALPADLRLRLDVRFVQSLTTTTPRIEAAVDEALALRPAAVIAPYADAAKAMRQRHTDIPVIFSSLLDPVRYEVVTSITARKEALTGVSIADDLDAKRIEILHDAYPQARRIAVLMDRDWGEHTEAARRLPALARSLGLEVSLLFAEDRAEAERVLAAPGASAYDAWILPPTGLAGLNSRLILERLRSWHKPVVLGRPQEVSEGAPLAYMADISFRWPAIAELLERILRGEPAGSIPVQRPFRTLLAVRPVPAEGFPAPAPGLVQRADLVFK